MSRIFYNLYSTRKGNFMFVRQLYVSRVLHQQNPCDPKSVKCIISINYIIFNIGIGSI